MRVEKLEGGAQERLLGDGLVASLSLRYSLAVGEIYGSNPCTKRIKNGLGRSAPFYSAALCLVTGPRSNVKDRYVCDLTSLVMKCGSMEGSSQASQC